MKQRPRMAVMETSRELARQDKQKCSSISSNKHVTLPMSLSHWCHCWAPRRAVIGGTGNHPVNVHIPSVEMHRSKHTCQACVAPLVRCICSAAAYSTSSGCVCVCNVCCREQRLEGFPNSSQFSWQFCERALWWDYFQYSAQFSLMQLRVEELKGALEGRQSLQR